MLKPTVVLGKALQLRKRQNSFRGIDSSVPVDSFGGLNNTTYIVFD
jgi:hypothetical protein